MRRRGQVRFKAVNSMHGQSQITVFVEFIFRRENLWYESPGPGQQQPISSQREADADINFSPFSLQHTGVIGSGTSHPPGSAAARRFIVWLAWRGAGKLCTRLIYIKQ